MEDDKKKKSGFTIVYDNSTTRGMIPVTGAYGGLSADGLAVVAHLYVEHGTVPSLSSHDIAEDGSVDTKQGQYIKRADLTREVQATIVLSLDHAEVVGTWLAKKGKDAKKAKEKEKDKS